MPPLVPCKPGWVRNRATNRCRKRKSPKRGASVSRARSSPKRGASVSRARSSPKRGASVSRARSSPKRSSPKRSSPIRRASPKRSRSASPKRTADCPRGKVYSPKTKRCRAPLKPGRKKTPRRIRTPEERMVEELNVLHNRLTAKYLRLRAMVDRLRKSGKDTSKLIDAENRLAKAEILKARFDANPKSFLNKTDIDLLAMDISAL